MFFSKGFVILFHEVLCFFLFTKFGVVFTAWGFLFVRFFLEEEVVLFSFQGVVTVLAKVFFS